MTTHKERLAEARRWAQGIEQLCEDQGIPTEVHLAFTDTPGTWTYTWRPTFPGPFTSDVDYFYSMEVARRIHTQFHQILLAAEGTRPECVLPSPMLQDLIDGGDGYGRPRGDDA